MIAWIIALKIYHAKVTVDYILVL